MKFQIEQGVMPLADVRNLRKMEGDGDSLNLAEFQGVASRWFVYLNMTNDTIYAWCEPTDGPVEWLKKIDKFPSFTAEFYDNAQQSAFVALVHLVLASIQEDIGS